MRVHAVINLKLKNKSRILNVIFVKHNLSLKIPHRNPYETYFKLHPFTWLSFQHSVEASKS